MFKRILKIVGIVLGCTVVGVGILTGVLALQGKFKKPYQEPNSIYFDIDENVLNVTYYCDNFVASQLDPNYELLSQDSSKKLNVYSFVLKATPDNVTELDCTMAVEKGGELIEFCSANGNAYAGGVRSKVKIGERVYFKIKNTFDNSIANNTTQNYNATNGEVKLYFNTSNNLRNAYLTIKIDRQANQLSLYDYKNPLNNTHSNGVFSYETGKYEQVSSPKVEDINKYFIREEDETGIYIYRHFGKNLDGTPNESDVFDENSTSYFTYNADTTLNITVEANSDYKLQPIFAPDNSNKPFNDKDAKLCDIFYFDKNIGNYYRLGDSSHTVDYLSQKDDGYYFNANQAGSYDMYVVGYPTYDVQKLFQQNFESDNTSDLIFNNGYAITRKVVFTVENSGVQEVYFNGGNTLNMNFDLFKDNNVAVHNSTISKNLNITMLNNNGDEIYSRLNQLTFLNKDHFVAGNVTFTSGNKTISIGENMTSATITGFDDNQYNGTHTYTTEYDSVNKQLLLTISVSNMENMVLKIPCNVSTANGIYKIDTYGKVASDSILNASWHMNDVLLVKVGTTTVEGKDTPVYTLGTLAVGSYLVMTQGEKTEFVNDKFTFVESNYGINKQFNIIPLEHLTEVSMYCLVVNKDKTAVYTNQPVNIQINYESAELSRIFGTTQPLKVKISSSTTTSQSYTVEELVRQVSGTYQYPLMFVDNSDIKVKTIPQIYFEANGRKYVLVGEMENGYFINKVVPLTNAIGVQNIYVRMVKYNYNKVQSYNDLFNMLMNSVPTTVNDTGRTFYEKITLHSAPRSWDGYYILDKTTDEKGTVTNVAINPVDDEAEFDEQATYLRKTDCVFVGSIVDDSGNIGQVDKVEIVKGEGTDNNLSITYTKLLDGQPSAQPIEIKIESAFDYVVGCETFNNNPIAELNITYVDKMDSNDEQETSSNLGFALNLYQNAEGKISLVKDHLEVFEGQKGKDGDSDKLYATIEVNSNYQFKNLINLIADINEEKLYSAGLNQYYTLAVNMYNYADQIGNVYKSNKLTYEIDNDGHVIYKFTDVEINQYIQVSAIELCKEEAKTYLKVYFNIGEDNLDNFENYAFSFVFEYGECREESIPIFIKSTAVKGYQFKNGESTYSFDDYKIVYKIGYEDGYTFTSYLTPKTEYIRVTNPTEDDLANYYIENNGKYEKVADGAEFSYVTVYYVKAETIELTTGKTSDDKLLDAELLKIDNNLSNYFATINDKYNEKEFSFNITNSNDNVLKVANNEIEILGKGKTTITLTNQIKTSVESTFDVEVDASAFELTASASQEISVDKTILDDNTAPIFQYQYGNENPKTQLFNVEGLVGLTIKNVTPIEFEVAEDGKSIVDKTLFEYVEVGLSAQPENWNGYYTYDDVSQNYVAVSLSAPFDASLKYYQRQNAKVLTVEYIGGEWQLVRNENYKLSVFSFDLVVSTKFTDDATCKFIYVSPVNIEQNAKNSMHNQLITYYQGTNLQLSVKKGTEKSDDNSDRALFKLTDNTEIGFSLQIEWYKQLTESRAFDAKKYFKYNNTQNQFVNIESSDEEDFINNPSNYYEWGWFDISEKGFSLSLNGTSIANTSHLPFDRTIKARIYYNDNKHYVFQFVMKHNVFVEANTIAVDKSQNSQSNPQVMNVGDELKFADIFSVTKFDTSTTYFDYAGQTASSEVANVSYSLDSASDMFGVTTESLKLDWVSITGENIYVVPIKIEVDGTMTIVQNYYVKAKSDYTIEQKQNLPILDAYLDTDFDVTKYFTIKKNEDNIESFSATIECFLDSAMTQEDDYLTLTDNKLKYSYPYTTNGTRYVVFTFSFEVDGTTRTLTNQMVYPIYINNFELTRNETTLTAGTSVEFVSLFSDFATEDDKLLNNADSIWKIVFENNNDITYLGENMLTSTSKTFKINPKIKGEDYTTTIRVFVYFDISNPDDFYTYDLQLEVNNPTKAKIENVLFEDLTLTVDPAKFANDNNTFLTPSGETISIKTTYTYQPVLAGEIVDSFNDIFAVYDANGNKLSNTLSTITLFGTINLVGDPDYLNKIIINNNDKTVTIGDFTRVGFAVFKLSDSDGTSAYYALRINPKTMSITEKYTGVIKTISGKQQRSVIKYTQTTDGSTVAEFLKANYTNMASKIGLAESVLTSNNIYYYLKSTDKVDEKDYITDSTGGSMIHKVVNDCDINAVNNPTQFTVAVLIKTTNAEVYLCDVLVTVMPNVTVTPKGDTKTEDGNFKYSRNVKYSYSATNTISFADILTVDSASVNSVSISELSENSINAVISADEKTIIDKNDNATTIFSVTSDGITLNKNIAEQLTITLQLKYSNGLIVTLVVNYLPFENTNPTRTYKLGWNGSSFDSKISRYTLVPSYNGEITAKLNGEEKTLSGNNYEFILTTEEQTKTLVLILTDIQGTPEYTFTIILGVNINQTIYFGETADDSVKTVLDANNNQSTLTLSGENTKELKLATGNMITDTTIAVIDYASNITVSSVNFYTLAGEWKDFVTQDGSTLKFVASATDIAGKLVIETNIGKLEIYATIAQTYKVEAIYRITKSVAGENVNAEYETVKVNSTLTFDDFMSTSLKNLILGDVTINSSRFVVKNMNEEELELSTIYSATADVNKVNWQVMMPTGNGLVADSNNIYHTLDRETNTITFKTAGTVYIRLTNATGLVLDYRINIQDDGYFVDNVTWNTANKNTDMTIKDGKISTASTYFSTDIATLTDASQKGFTLASLTFNPSDVTDLTYFRLYVNSYTKNGTLTTGANNYNSSDETRGEFEVTDGITLSYRVEEFKIILTASGTTNDIEFGEFEIYFVTINGVSTTIKLNITNTTITSGVDTGLEEIYANQEDLTLSTELSNGKPRLTITNVQYDEKGKKWTGTTISYNTDADKTKGYKLFFNGWRNETTGVEYPKDDTSLIVVRASNDYMTDVFSLKSIATDNNISLHYYLTYKGKIIATFDYSFVIKNDINITMNNFDNTSSTSFGDVYLNNYKNDSGFKIDLINKTDGTYYRNEYIIYKNLRTNKTIFAGASDNKTISNYMKFELIDSYFTKEDADSYATRDKFLSTEVSISADGVLTVTADKSGKIGVKVTAQNCPTYSVIFELNVHATINVTQKYSDNEIDSGTDGYQSLNETTLISYDSSNKDAMIYLDKTKTDSSYATATSEITETINYGGTNSPRVDVSYAIKSNLTETVTFVRVTGLSFTGKLLKVKLPVVPFSSTERYVVTYKIDLTANDTTRTFYANYLVKNSEGMQERVAYQNKTITVGAGAQTDKNLMIYKQLSSTDNSTTNSTLFTGQKETPTLLATNGATKIKFANIVDATGKRTDTSAMSITENSGVYSINLGTDNIFHNSMTFDIVFLNSDGMELFRSSGWTMQANGQVTPKNSKAFIDLFTEAELGNELLDKNFVAVTNGTAASASWFNSGSVDTASNIKTISRNVGTTEYKYTIYSFTASVRTDSTTFYDLTGTFYFISSTVTNLIEVTDNYYISYIVEDISKDLTLDISKYATVFNGDFTDSTNINSIAFASSNSSSITVSGATVSITDISGKNIAIKIGNADLKKLVENKVSSIEFTITISGGGTSRNVKVVLTLPTT